MHHLNLNFIEPDPRLCKVTEVRHGNTLNPRRWDKISELVLFHRQLVHNHKLYVSTYYGPNCTLTSYESMLIAVHLNLYFTGSGVLVESKS